MQEVIKEKLLEIESRENVRNYPHSLSGCMW